MESDPSGRRARERWRRRCGALPVRRRARGCGPGRARAADGGVSERTERRPIETIERGSAPRVGGKTESRPRLARGKAASCTCSLRAVHDGTSLSIGLAALSLSPLSYRVSILLSCVVGAQMG